MSATLIIVIATAAAALIGIKVYFEYREEKEAEKAKEADVFEDLNTLIVNPAQNIVIEEPKVEPVPAQIEPIVETKKEAKPKAKKKRYYGKPAIKKAPNKKS